MEKTYHLKLQELKDRSGMTNQQISEESKIPASTVAKIMSNTTDSPSFDAVCAIVKAMGGSVDEIVGIKTASASPIEVACSQLKASFDRHNEYRNLHEAKMEKVIRYMAIAIAVLVCIFIFLFIFDLLNTTRGWIIRA